MRDELRVGGTVAEAEVAGGGAVAVEPGRVTEGGSPDPGAARLQLAVRRLRRELAAHPADLSDRAVAEDELAVLDAMVTAGLPEVPRLRHSLLLVAGAVGSVSALGPALGELRKAVELFAQPPG